MSPAAAFHAQLASIMEVLANTAVVEICELVDSGYAVLQLEISRSRKENEVLRRKLRLMELRAARGAATVAAGAASHRARAPVRGNEARQTSTPGGEAVLSQVSPQQRPPESRHETPQEMPDAGESASLTTAVIKVEEEEEEEEEEEKSWPQPEQESFVQPTETEAPRLQPKREAADEGGSSRPWAGGEVGSPSMSVQETSVYDCRMFEPQLHCGPCASRGPLGEDPGCSYALHAGAGVSADSAGDGFPFTVGVAGPSAAEHRQPEGFTDTRQRAPQAVGRPRLAARKEVAERQNTFTRRGGWRHLGGASRAAHGGGRSFVCNCCGKTLACLKNLKTHMRVHTGEKPFVCALCGKRFSDSSNLKRHQSVHTGEKRYGCVHCGKRFAQSGSLKVHMTVHTDCKQFKCSYCGKMFISGSHLRRHVSVHVGEKRFAAPLQ